MMLERCGLMGKKENSYNPCNPLPIAATLRKAGEQNCCRSAWRCREQEGMSSYNASRKRPEELITDNKLE
jgi:hypothetical protein